MLVDSVGQEFGKDTVDTARLCPVMSAASAGKTEQRSWRIPFSDGFFIHIWLLGWAAQSWAH